MTNVAAARIYGGELELVALGAKGLRVEATLGYLDPLGIVNATLTYVDSNDRWSARLYGRNLTDKQYVLFLHEYSHVVGGPGGLATMADPREYGLTVTRKF